MEGKFSIETVDSVYKVYNVSHAHAVSIPAKSPSMRQLKKKSKRCKQRALTYSEESKYMRIYKPKSLTNVCESSEFDFDNKFEPKLCSFTRLEHDDHVWKPSCLAEQTTSISIQSMPAHLNRITEFQDEHSALARPDSSPNVKRSHSENVKTKRYLQLDEQILETQRSKSLTHIECVEEAICDNIQQDLARFNVSSSSADAGLVSQRHLAVSMGDISKIDPSRGKLQKSIKASSHETFRVSFDYNDEHVQEYLPASQGVTLRDALRDLLDHRNIDVNSVQFYQEYSNTPFLPFCDTSRLAGCQLRLKIKPTSTSSWDKENGIHEKPFLSLSKK
uniref:RBD domain-containing protein n=1 Tax=Strigamia maritima TaxID=126957 RepID=T1JDF8_STRMM